MISADNVIACVTEAWDGESYNEQIDRELLRTCNDQESQEAIEQFVGKNWQEVKPAILLEAYPNPFLIGDTALRYYLPAFLICAVQTLDDESFDLVGFLIEFQLRFPKKPHAIERFRSRFDPLTCDQKRAVVCFLRYCMQYYSAFNERAVRRMKYSIDHYWSPKQQN